jgi:hypothetical protein
MRLQMILEDVYCEIGQMVDKEEFKGVVILIDRGLLDGSAYVDEDDWQALMDDLGTNTT